MKLTCADIARFIVSMPTQESNGCILKAEANLQLVSQIVPMSADEVLHNTFRSGLVPTSKQRIMI